MNFKKYFKKVRYIFLILVLVSVGILNISVEVNAKDTSKVIEGELLEFERGSDYEITEPVQEKSIVSESSYGKFSVKGNIKAIPKLNGVNAYEVLDDNVVMTYELADTYITEASNQWHLIEDRSNVVNGEELDADIGTGAIIVQTSLTGNVWVTDTVYTDIRGEESTYSKEFYTSKNIQQVNGCYYRVLVAYEVKKEEKADKSITNWLGTEKQDKAYAEIYKFYLIDSSENSEDVTSPTDTPRKELGSKINTGKDNGYSGDEGISSKDPHYGWDIGTFFVNGYTRETTDDVGNPVFLKNVGDRVTLWFNLNEDIDCLNNKGNLSISEDLNGYNQNFEVEKTNFKRGTLIIRYTDHEGKVHEPIIYTDYLAANARTGANTKVELFQEGDYEVVLNYEIEDSNGIDSYTNYRIEFEFSIRNGNSMVYPFDTASGAELSNQNITENGFRLDMARSRYLTIDVLKEVIKSSEGGYITDERFNKPAKDGEIYSGEGIYTFTVKNLYTNSEPTTKVIYVGTSPEIRAMARGNTLDEINELIAEGAKLQENGTLVLPMLEEKIPENSTEEKEEVIFLDTSKEFLENIEDNTEDTVEAINTETEVENTKGGEHWVVVSVLIGLGITTIVIIVAQIYIKGQNNQGANSDEITNQENISEEVDKE